MKIRCMLLFIIFLFHKTIQMETVPYSQVISTPSPFQCNHSMHKPPSPFLDTGDREQTRFPGTGLSSCFPRCGRPCGACRSGTPGGGCLWGVGLGTSAGGPSPASYGPYSCQPPMQNGTSCLKSNKEN